MNIFYSSADEDPLSWWGLGLVAIKLMLGLLILLQIPVSTVIAIALVSGAASAVIPLILKRRSNRDSDVGQALSDAAVEASNTDCLRKTAAVASRHAELQCTAPNVSVTCAAVGWWWTTDWTAKDEAYPIIGSDQ
jgi:hypothetical protein